MNEGDEIEFTCRGDIGSSTTLQFEWWITSNMGFIKFRPDIQPNAVETQGEATQGSTACSYSRTTTMKYNITATDKNRGSLTFMCFAQVNQPSAQSYPQNSTAFYIIIGKRNLKVKFWDFKFYLKIQLSIELLIRLKINIL